MDSVSNARTCTLFKPGHHVHWIHWKVGTSDSDEQVAVVGEIVVVDDGRVRFELAVGTVVIAWSHDPGRTERLTRRLGDRAVYSGRHHLLAIRDLPLADGPCPAAFVNLAVDVDDLTPCRSNT